MLYVTYNRNKSHALKQQLCWDIIQYRLACCCCCYFRCFGRICHLIHVIKTSQNMSSSTIRSELWILCVVRRSSSKAHFARLVHTATIMQVEERQRKSRHIHKNHFHFHEFSADFRSFCFCFFFVCKKDDLRHTIEMESSQNNDPAKTARTFFFQQIPRLAITSPSHTKHTQHTNENGKYEMGRLAIKNILNNIGQSI